MPTISSSSLLLAPAVSSSEGSRRHRCCRHQIKVSQAMRTVIDCDSSRADAILEIFNDAIANSTALYEYRPWTSATMEAWFDAKRQGQYPVIGVVDEADRLL